MKKVSEDNFRESLNLSTIVKNSKKRKEFKKFLSLNNDFLQ